MKIILVAPPNKSPLVGNNPAIIDQERGKNPPLGLLYIASMIKNSGLHDLEVLDCNAQDIDYKRLNNHFNNGYDVLGVTVTSFTLIDALKTIAIYKKTNPQGKVIVGGPHVAIYHAEIIKFDNIDIAVKKEGEFIINKILDVIFTPSELKNIPGIVYKKDNKITDTGEAEYIKNLDILPIPDRSLLPYKSYFSLLGSQTYSTTIFTSRGCPFNCAFCDRPALGKAFRAHSADYVVKEIEECVKLGIKEFLFYDDTFTINRNRVIDICNTIIEKKIIISFDIRARVDTVDEQILRLLKKAGCQAVHFGVESGTDRILKRLNKGITIKKVKKAFAAAKQVKMNTLAYFMVGCPGETHDDINKTLALAKELNPDYVHVTIFTPFPATILYKEALYKQIIKKDVWQEFAQNPSILFHPPIWEEGFTKETLGEIIKKFYKQFYLRPSYILKRIIKIRSFSELFRHVKAGLNLLRMRQV